MQFKIYRAKEDELITGCRKRDRNAQKALYDTYSSKMYGLCYRYLKDPMEAEDVLVIAFTRILERIDQYKGEGSFEGWIRRIVVNEALTCLRKRRNMHLEAELGEADYQLDYRNLEDHLQAEDLVQLINALPTGYRIVFNMYAIDGYSHKEIADALGISENTSKSQLSRARTYLQKALKEQEWMADKKLNNDESTTAG
jgi:RNA polymerase sigma-70 factor (ECF subfamily)